QKDIEYFNNLRFISFSFCLFIERNTSRRSAFTLWRIWLISKAKEHSFFCCLSLCKFLLLAFQFTMCSAFVREVNIMGFKIVGAFVGTQSLSKPHHLGERITFSFPIGGFSGSNFYTECVSI